MIGLLVAVEQQRERREQEKREAERRRIAVEARRARERLEKLERERVSRFEGLAKRLGRSRRRVYLGAVKTEAARRQVTADADTGFARWLGSAERYAQAVDPGYNLPVY